MGMLSSCRAGARACDRHIQRQKFLVQMMFSSKGSDAFKQASGSWCFLRTTMAPSTQQIAVAAVAAAGCTAFVTAPSTTRGPALRSTAQGHAKA
eukprot:s505_g2.t1